MTPESSRDWCQLFMSIIDKTPPACAMSDDLDERESNPWWKAKKWAYSSLLRLFSRYALFCLLPLIVSPSYADNDL